MASIQTPSKIGIISDALVLLGETPTTDLSDNRYGVTVGANLFEVIYESELQSGGYGWRFAKKKNALSRLVSAPLNTWAYAYQLPSDCLLPIGIAPRALYEIYGDKLYTDQSAVDFDYMFKPDVSELPAYFQLLLTYALARDMAKPVTESDEHFKKNELAYNRQRNVALFADAQGRPSTTIPDAFTASRSAREARVR